MTKKLLIVIAMLLCLCSIQSANAAPVQWSTSVGGNGHWYEAVYVPTFITWSAANVIASSAGGHLATITSAQENEFVYNLITDNKFWRVGGNANGPWIGGYQNHNAPDYSEPAGGWRWVTDEPFVYTNWFPEALNNGAGGPTEDCMHFWGDPTGGKTSMWNDAPNAEPIFGYITEYDTSVPIAHPLPIDSIASAELTTFYQSPPTGNLNFAGIPFFITSEGFNLFATSVSGPGTPPTSFTLSTNIQQPLSAHILICGTSVGQQYNGMNIGNIVFTFAGSESQIFNLIAGETIRDWVSYPGVLDTTSSPNVTMVWHGASQSFWSNYDAVINMLTLPLTSQSMLTSVTLNNTIPYTSGLFVYGVTILSAPGPVIQGTVKLKDFWASKLGITGTATINDGINTETCDIVLDVRGNYSFTTSLTGICSVTIKCSHWLSKTISDIEIADGINIGEVTLTNGDVVDNNEVDFSDINAVRAAYGSIEGDDNWNELADVDRTGEVDFTDINIVRSNYGEIGE